MGTTSSNTISANIVTKITWQSIYFHEVDVHYFTSLDKTPDRFSSDVLLDMSDTRTVLGPLTTIFDRAPDICNTPILYPWYNGSSTLDGVLGQTCSGGQNAPEPSCYPSATTAGPYWGLLEAFFSPGSYCPSGYETSCFSTEGLKDGYRFHFSLEPGEVAAGCCPM